MDASTNVSGSLDGRLYAVFRATDPHRDARMPGSAVGRVQINGVEALTWASFEEESAERTMLADGVERLFIGGQKFGFDLHSTAGRRQSRFHEEIEPPTVLMKLYLIRHGIAEDASARITDDERALTDEGRDKMQRAANGLATVGTELDLVFTSPLRRACQTAAIVAAALGNVEVRVLKELALGADPKRVVAALRAHRELDAVALVGHQPDLGRLASFLATGSASSYPLDFKKGGVACFEASIATAGECGRLEWFVPPKLLRGLAGDRTKGS